MRDDILGHLLGALEPDERARFERLLEQHPELQAEYEILRRSIELLGWDDEHDYEPPPGLAARTCRLVAERREQLVAVGVTVERAEAASARSAWSVLDLAVAAGILLAAGLLFFPAVQTGRHLAHRSGCQHHLRQLSQALVTYSQGHDEFFPEIPLAGPRSVAGIYGPLLLASGALADAAVLHCPTCPTAQGQAELPPLAEIDRASGAQLAAHYAALRGNYGYTLGYRDGRGEYHGVRNRQRSHFALLADAPCSVAHLSKNHDQCGQNVLYEDGHARFLCEPRDATGDHLYLNANDEVAFGTSPDDAVIVEADFRTTLLGAR